MTKLLCIITLATVVISQPACGTLGGQDDEPNKKAEFHYKLASL